MHDDVGQQVQVLEHLSAAMREAAVAAAEGSRRDARAQGGEIACLHLRQPAVVREIQVRPGHAVNNGAVRE